MFDINLQYTDRESKARFVFTKYQSILSGSILDVGADKAYLKSLLPTDTQYLGIDIESSEFVQSINLEKDQLPFAPGQFNCVLALDVLEHVDNIYEVFDSLCRVSADYVIISLPNPWAAMIAALQNGSYQDGMHMKFYGLPIEPPADRHKWFFSYSEAKGFVHARAAINSMHVLDIYTESIVQPQAITDLLQVWGSLGKGIIPEDLYIGTQWYVLKKINNK
jgi:hypothetical protein